MQLLLSHRKGFNIQKHRSYLRPWQKDLSAGSSSASLIEIPSYNLGTHTFYRQSRDCGWSMSFPGVGAAGFFFRFLSETKLELAMENSGVSQG